MCLGCTWGHLHSRLKITYRAVNIYLLDLQERCWLQLQWVAISLCHWIWSQTIFFASSYCCEFPLSRAIGCPEINRGLLFHLASLKILFPHVHRLAFYFLLSWIFCWFWSFWVLSSLSFSLNTSLYSCFKYLHGFETLHGIANNALFP